VGNTPLLELSRYAAAHDLPVTLLAKLEMFNPAGSNKDRLALAMIEAAEKSGALKANTVIIEPTSGNTGIGLAALAAARGYRLILTMPQSASLERRKLLKAYGAELVLTPADEGMPGAIAKAEELAAELPDAYVPAQFSNPVNAPLHEATTGPEIWEDTGGHIDLFVTGIGTGGTISGAGSYLKSKNPFCLVVAVEPADCPVLSGGTRGAHKIEGIGPGFVPKVLNTRIYDEVITVTSEDAFRTAREVTKCDGVLAGISSGAALWAATLLARRPEHAGKTIVVMFFDSGERYLSSELFS
jgi:cysteine synthase A